MTQPTLRAVIVNDRHSKAVITAAVVNALITLGYDIGSRRLSRAAEQILIELTAVGAVTEERDQ